MPILPVYKEFFDKKNIILDEAQLSIVSKLCNLHVIIDKYREKRNHKLLRILTKPRVPKGIYIWGDVGRGKSMLVNAFFQNVNLTKKQHVHFHSFMNEVHKLLHKQREKNKTANKFDYLSSIAKNFAKKYRLIYIDELEIHDITDAMIVGKLFRELFKNNIMIITTSNRKPDDLYLNGLQRELFLDFIELIKQQLEIVELKSNKDYRLEKIKGFKQTYFTPLGTKATQFIQESFAELTNNAQPIETKLVINKREFICKNTFKDIAIFNFTELFSTPLGSADYIAICRNFNIVLISDIPKLTPENRDEARRFITFIDTMYDHKTILICTSEVDPTKIYEYGKGIFEFERTISRLIEMQSEDYIKKKIC